MRIKNYLIPSGLLAFALFTLPSSPASACSGPPCREGSFVPATGAVPASIPGIRWTPKIGYSGAAADPAGVTLSRVVGGVDEMIAISVETASDTGDYVIKPGSPLEPDTIYHLSGTDYCNIDGTNIPTEATFTTGPAAPLPDSLGVLTVKAPSIDPALDVWTVSGSCTSPITASTASFSLELSEEAAPWEQALIRTTLVDGEVWNRTSNLIYAQCATTDSGTDPGLKEGAHTIVIQATLPGTALKIETDPVTVTLDCNPQNNPDDDPPVVSTPPDDNTDLDVRACSVNPRSLHKGGAGSLALVGLAALIAIGRRRRGAASARS